MLKVFGFVRRNEKLSHDDYRAAHIGHHNSYGRRLPNIRGYILNVRANQPIEESLGPIASAITRGEPADFDELWDGWGQLMFDNLDDYLSARSPARDRAGPSGLEEDPKVAEVGGDGGYLYTGSPFQFHIDEHVAKPVLRPERKIFKLAQFSKRAEGLSPEEFRAYWTGRYAALQARLPGLHGHIINFRTPLDVRTGFFDEGAECFTPEGTALREHFFSGFDGIAELWFDEASEFANGRADADLAAELDAMEAELFDRVWYREVDETVAVNPNRLPAPSFHYR